MERLRDGHHQENSNDIPHKGPSEFVRGLEKASHENQVEQPETNKGHAQREQIPVHQRVAPIYGGIRKHRHPQNHGKGHQQEAAKLNGAGEQVLPLHHVLLGDGKQRGEHHVVGLPGVLEALENPQCHKEYAAQNGIAREEKHQPEGDKEKRQQRRAEFQLFQKDITHGRSPFPGAEKSPQAFLRVGNTAAQSRPSASRPRSSRRKCTQYRPRTFQCRK